MKSIFSITLFFLIPAVSLAAPELSGTPHELSQYLLDQKKIINIHGEAEEKVEADIATVAISVKTKENQLNQALQKNAEIRKNLKEKLIQAGIASDKIKSSKFSSTPNYGWFKDKPKNYEVSNEVKISITDEAQLQAIAKLVDSQKEIFLGTTEHEDSAKEDNKLKVLESALNYVQKKRALYEKNLGISLIPVRISSQNVFEQRTKIRHRAVKQASEGAYLSSQSADMALESPQPSSDFGSITYKANTIVEFIVNEQL